MNKATLHAQRVPLNVRRWVVALAVAPLAVLSIGGCFAVQAGASTSRAKTISCSTVSSAIVKSALGIAVGKPSSMMNGAVDVCTFKGTGTSSASVIVRFETSVTKSAFSAGRKLFDSHGEPTKTVAKLGDSAFSSVIGSGQYVTSTISVLKKTTNVQISAPASVAKVEVLIKKLLPSI